MVLFADEEFMKAVDERYLLLQKLYKECSQLITPSSLIEEIDDYYIVYPRDYNGEKLKEYKNTSLFALYHKETKLSALFVGTSLKKAKEIFEERV